MTTFIFIRHGESEANEQRRFAGFWDINLSEKGKRQAALTAQYVFENYKVDEIYSSDLKRAYSTAEPLAKLLKKSIHKEETLREISAGEWEGVLFDELRIRYKEDYRLWREDIGNSRCSGGESVRELSERIWNSVSKIEQENTGKTVAVVSHATPIRTLLSRCKGVDIKDLGWVSNASVTVITCDKGVWTVVAESIDKHLSALKTELPKNV